jgi:uncharacterized membrane protein YkvA (DUF1232 family)
VNVFKTISTARHELPRVLPLLRDSRIPLRIKIAAGLAAIFIISPLNILGDIPMLGFLEDATLLLLLAHWFVGYGERTLANVAASASAAAPTTMRDVSPKARAPRAGESMLTR